MNRGWVLALGAVAMAAAGLSGCSNDKSGSGSSSQASTASPATVTSGAMSATVGAGTAKVSIDGTPQDIAGQVVCSTNGGNTNIAIGEATTGIGIMLTEDASKVASVGLGNVNGVALGFQDGAPGGSASATKDGKTYRVTGTATGVDMANPMAPITKPFEIEVTCP